MDYDHYFLVEDMTHRKKYFLSCLWGLYVLIEKNVFSIIQKCNQFFLQM